MPTALAARTRADRRPATAGTAAHARDPTRGLPLEGMRQLSISALSPADVLYLQRCAGNEAVCALMNRCPDDAPVQRKGPAAAPAAKPKAPPFTFAPGCDLKIPVEGSAPGVMGHGVGVTPTSLAVSGLLTLGSTASPRGIP